MKKNILIVGGTSGLGLELAKHYVDDGHKVCVTGRHDPDLSGSIYLELDISGDEQKLIESIDSVVVGFPGVNTLVYAAGFCLRGRIDTYSDQDIMRMTNVGLLAPMLLVRRLKNSLQSPLKVMLITSSSQYTPRAVETAYCAVKAGLGMFGASLALDPEIGKVLVAAPSGIDTNFWRGTDADVAGMLDAKWTCERIVELSGGQFKYKYAKILRNPARVVVEECLNDDIKVVQSEPSR